MEMTGRQQITILHVCSTDESKSKEFLADKQLLQVYSMDDGKPESVISNKSSTEDSKSESVHKIINEEKYAIDEAEHEEPPITDNHFSRIQAILTYSSVVKCLE